MPQPSIQPSRLPAAFVAIALVVGASLVFLVPPFQVPDEPNHFLRAYQISEGRWVPVWKDNRGGGSLPVSLGTVYGRFDAVRRNLQTTSRQGILEAIRIPIRPEECRYYSFPNTAAYTPLVYLPQALGIALGRAAGFSVLGLMYTGRLLNLLVFIAFGFSALRRASTLSRPLFLLMVMPMTLFEAASLSPDAITDGLAFLLAGLLWREIVTDSIPSPGVSRWRLIVATVCAAAGLSLTKVAYFPLAVLVVLVPVKRLGGWKWFWAMVSATLFFSLASIALWSFHTPGLSMVVHPESSQVKARSQLGFLRAHPISLLRIPVLSSQRDGMLIILSFVGRLGWLSIQLPIAFVAAYLAMVVFSCRPNRNDSPEKRRWLLICGVALAVSASSCVILLLDELFWTTVGGERVDGLQGRYFIATAAFAVMMVRGIWELLPKRFRSNHAESERDLLAIIIGLVGCGFMITFLYMHYYVAVGFGLV